MKKLIIWLAAIIGIVIAVDVLFGITARAYTDRFHLKGDYRSVDHIVNDTTDRLVVIGSSVALNSIDTGTLSDSLHIKAYNAGCNGQDFPYLLSLMEIIAGRQDLDTVILGFTESSLTGTGLGSRYNFLIPYYHRGFDGIDERLEGGSAFERLMLRSSLYRYNTIWFRILLYSFFEPGIPSGNGFIAKDIPPAFPNQYRVEARDAVTPERAQEFDAFVRLCRDNGIRLIVCIPPQYELPAEPTPVEEFLCERAATGDFELWLDNSSTPLSADSTMFYDPVHLNYAGAEIYTDTIINRLSRPNEN